MPVWLVLGTGTDDDSGSGRARRRRRFATVHRHAARGCSDGTRNWEFNNNIVVVSVCDGVCEVVWMVEIVVELTSGF